MVGLDGELRLADGGDTLDGGLTEVSAVAGLGDLAGNGLVGPKVHREPLISCFHSLSLSYCKEFSRKSVKYLLASGLAATNGGRGSALGGLVGGSSLLADDNNTTLLTGGDTNSLYNTFALVTEFAGFDIRACVCVSDRGYHIVSYLFVDKASVLPS